MGKGGAFGEPVVVKPGAIVYALLRDMATAIKIVKCAAQFGLVARNFDKAEAVIESARSKKPFLIILDFEHCEAEAYKTLKEFQKNADLKSVPFVGFVTKSREAVKGEAERAGCDRVYMKTEFDRELPNLMTRYAK